jgi:hypothetical protein
VRVEEWVYEATNRCSVQFWSVLALEKGDSYYLPFDECLFLNFGYSLRGAIHACLLSETLMLDFQKKKRYSSGFHSKQDPD